MKYTLKVQNTGLCILNLSGRCWLVVIFIPQMLCLNEIVPRTH